MDWLLKECPQVATERLIFSLLAEFDRSQGGGDIGSIRSLRVKGNATPQMAISPVPDGQPKEIKTSRRIADRLVQFAQAIPLVEALFGKAKADSLAASLGPEEYFVVDATVKVRGRRTAESQKKFRDIASDIADQSDAVVKIEGKDGQISNGDAILRTKMLFNLPYEDSNLLDFDNVDDQIQEVYKRFVKDGKIKA